MLVVLLCVISKKKNITSGFSPLPELWALHSIQIPMPPPRILQLQSTSLCFSWPCTFPILPKPWEVAVPVSQAAVREGALDRVQDTWLSWLLIFDGITVSRWLFSAERSDIRIQDQSQTTFSKIFNCVPHSRVLLPLLGQTCSLSDIHLASDLTEVCLVQLSQARHTSPRKHHLSDALFFT